MLGKMLPKDKNLIMFESFLGKQYSDNPRAIYEYLLKHYPEYKMYWSAERKSVHKFEQYDVKYVKRFSIKWMFLMNRAAYWVSNSRLPLWIPKHDQTTYLQTWHGTPLKRLALDMDEVHMPGIDTEAYKSLFKKSTQKWDYLISPNRYATEIFRRAFQFDKDMLETGYPRNDYLLNHNHPEEIERIKKKLGLPLDKKVILYAPTWRDNQFYEIGRYKFEVPLDLDLLQRELSDEYIIVLRMHYLVAENLEISKYGRFVQDESLHEDIRELYMIADMLVTDYSSVFFDYGNLRRPMFFYVYDMKEYRDTLRGFYYDFEKEAPGPLVETTAALIKEIRRAENSESLGARFDDFYRRFCALEDGHAAKRVVERVFLNQ